MLLALPLDQIELEPFYAHILFDVVRLANCLGLISSSIEEIKFKLCTVYVHRLLVICSKLKAEKGGVCGAFLWQCGFIWFSKTDVSVSHGLNNSLFKTCI